MGVKRSGGLYFDGLWDSVTGYDYIFVPNSSSLNNFTNEITINFWVRIVSPPPYKNYPFILDKGRSELKGFWVVIYKFDGAVKVGCGDGTTYKERGVSTIYDNNYHMFTAVINNSNVSIYIDGELDYTTTITITPVLSSTNDLYIGKYQSGAASNIILNNLRIYNRALSEDEIQKLYNGINIKDGCVLYLPMNEHSGSTVYDHSGHGNHGTIYGAKWVVKEDKE